MTTRLIVLPDTDGELQFLLESLGDVAVMMSDAAELGPLVRLGRAIHWAREDNPIFPLFPGSTYELGSLWFYDVDCADLEIVRVVLSTMRLATIDDLLDLEVDRPEWVHAGAGRLAHLLAFDGGDDARTLRLWLDPRHGQRVELSPAAYTAYQRLVGGLLDAWAPGDPLARFAALGFS